MFRWLVFFGGMTTHCLLVAYYHRTQLGLIGLVVLGWLAGLYGSLEPSPTQSHRHRDVMAAERTELGQVLLYREGWIPTRTLLAVGGILLSMVVGMLSAFPYVSHRDTRTLVDMILWMPVVLALISIVMASLVNMWVVSVPVLFFALLFGGIDLLRGSGSIATRVAGALGISIASLFFIDMLRAIRRATDKSSVELV